MVNMRGGHGNVVFGRNGVKFDYSKLQKVRELLNKQKIFTIKPLEEIQEFKDGGKMNVIPEGSLHARLHHMENAEGRVYGAVDIQLHIFRYPSRLRCKPDPRKHLSVKA